MSKLNLSEIETPLRSKSMSLHPSPQINTLSIKQIGDYILGEEVGSGAFGKVVLGKHILTEEKVAIKILDKMILNQTPEDYELVRKEISILKLVKHKFIVQLYEILQTAQHIFIIMEYCEGKEIMDYILTKNRLSELESLKYFQQLINCLFYLHSQNIAHRDVKIDNMLLDKNKDLKLIDFGLSTKYTDDSLLDQPCGTVVYAAPEVLEGKEYHGMLADVWSSGIVLYGMLSGFLPFADKDDETNKQQVIKGEINYPDFFSDEVKDLLKHMLDIDPMTRYTLQEIKDHPWFNMTECILIPGIIIDYNLVPVDEKILNLCVTYNKDKNEVYDSVRNNRYDSNSALYYLLIKKLRRKKGFQSVSDLCSDEFIEYILDENNLVNPEEINNSHQNINDDTTANLTDKKNENDNANENTDRNINNNENEEEEEILFENMNIMIREKNEIKEENDIIIENIKEHLDPKQEIIIEHINFHNEAKEESKEQKENKEDSKEKEEKDNQIENGQKKLKEMKEENLKEDREIVEEEKMPKGIIMEEIINEEKEEKEDKEILEDRDKEKEKNEKDIEKEECKNEDNIVIENEKKNEIKEIPNKEIEQKTKIAEINKEILNKNIENNDEKIDEKPNKLIDLLNSSFSQKQNIEESNKDIKDTNNDNLQNENIPTKENLDNEKGKNVDENQIDKNIIKSYLIKEPHSNQDKNNNNQNENIDKNNETKPQEILEKVEENILNENICFSTPIIEKVDDNKILELKRKIIEEGEKEINEKLKAQNKTNEKENNTSNNNNINEKKLFEEIIVKEDSINKENEDSNIQKISKSIEIENKNKEKKKEDIINIENKDINICNENKKENNTSQIQDKNELKNELDNKKEQNKENDNNLQILIKTQIDLTVNDGYDTNEERKEELKMENTINNIEVIDIKINKEKNINLKNDKKYQKTCEKNKSKILQSKKSNNKIKYIFKSQKKKLYSIEKSSNALNNLKKSQSKLKYINKPKISIGTEIKNSKNRSVFKMQYSQNANNKRDNSVGHDTFKKDFSNIENYSTRNPQKKLIFTNSKPNIDFNKKSTNKKNHTNLRKKTSNKIFKIINILNNNNNFNSTGKDIKLKNFIHSSSQNYQNIKLNKTNLHSKFEEIAKDRNKEKKDDLKKSIQFKAYKNLSLNKNESNSIYNFSKNKSMSNKNQNIINRNSNIKKNDKFFINYNSLINKSKKKNTNKLNISNVLKSIICLEYVDKNDKKSNSKNKRSSKNIIKNYNKSISHNYNKNNDLKNKELIGAITEEKHTDKKSRHMESSVIVNRYKSPIGIRQLSESPKQKYLNIKTRYARIPWKIKKKGIDEKLDSNAVYSKYLNKIENPFNQNNSKIVNYNKMNKILRNSLNPNQKFNRSVWTTNIKQIKIGNYNNCYNNNKKPKNSKNRFYFKEKTSRNNNQLSKEKLTSLNKAQKEKVNIKNNNIISTPNKVQRTNFNSISKSNLKVTNINSLALMKQYFKKNEIIINANKKNFINQNLKGSINLNNIHHQHSNSLTSSLTINLQNKFTISDCSNSVIYKPIDLSCLFFKNKDINEVCINLKSKLRKNSINYVQKKNNIFVCNKNGYNCEFEIIDINEQKNGENDASNAYFENIFYLKTYGKKEGYRINDIFKKFILNLD